MNKPVVEWSVDEVGDWLREHGFDDIYIDAFKRE